MRRTASSRMSRAAFVPVKSAVRELRGAATGAAHDGPHLRCRHCCHVARHPQDTEPEPRMRLRAMAVSTARTVLLSVRSKQPNTSKKGKPLRHSCPTSMKFLKELRETGKVEPTIVYVHGRTGKPCSVAPQNHEHTTVSCCMCMRLCSTANWSLHFAYLSSHFTLACAICPQKLRRSAASSQADLPSDDERPDNAKEIKLGDYQGFSYRPQRVD